MVYGHCLADVVSTINETVNRLTLLTNVMQNHPGDDSGVALSTSLPLPPYSEISVTTSRLQLRGRLGIKKQVEQQLQLG